MEVKELDHMAFRKCPHCLAGDQKGRRMFTENLFISLFLKKCLSANVLIAATLCISVTVLLHAECDKCALAAVVKQLV